MPLCCRLSMRRTILLAVAGQRLCSHKNLSTIHSRGTFWRLQGVSATHIGRTPSNSGLTEPHLDVDFKPENSLLVCVTTSYSAYIPVKR